MPKAILDAGEKIEAMHTIGDTKGYVPGVVVKFRLDKTYDIRLDDGTRYYIFNPSTRSILTFGWMASVWSGYGAQRSG
jgi:hypothetical protein